MLQVTLAQNPHVNALLGAGLFVAGGLLLGISQLLGGDTDIEEIRRGQLAKTLGIYGVAGLIAWWQGDAFSEPAIIGATALAAPVVNTVWDLAAPPNWGGSPRKGRGSGPTSDLPSETPDTPNPQTPDTPQQYATKRLAEAGWTQLRSIAAETDVNGNQSEGDLRSQLSDVNAHDLVTAIESAESDGKQ